MNRSIRLAVFLLLTFFTGEAFSQDSLAVRFSYHTQRLNDSEVILSIKGKIAPEIKLFALRQSPDDVLYSSVHFDSSASLRLKDSLVQKKEIQNAIDASLQSKVYYFTDSVEWQQKIKALPADSFLVKGTISYMYQKGDEYIPKEEAFQQFILPQTSYISSNPKEAQLTQANDGGTVARQSLWWIFFTAFAGGLLALITPCVYSMIPVTVAFFTKRSKTRPEGIKNAVLYSTSIVIIFTLLGLLITILFGPTALNNLATNWIANLIFFLIFFFLF